VQFDENGAWYGLILSPDGGLDRATGSFADGTWELVGMEGFNGSCSFQLVVHFDMSFVPSTTSFFDRPRAMLLGTGGDGAQPRFVAVK
jgi:hypothetical protein